MTLEDRKNALISEIESAFSDTKLGKGTSLNQGAVIDEYGSPNQIEEARKQDPWERWSDIPVPALVECGSTNLCHFDSEGFIFHLPAFMRAAVRAAPADPHGFYDSCIYHLTREPSNVIKEYQLTSPQIRVIAKFWELHFDFSDTNLGEHHEKRLLEWLAAAAVA